MKRKAFTLTEVVIAILVLGIMAASLTLSPDSAKQTAKREADMIVTQLYRLIETANRKHVSFKVLFNGEEQTEYVDVEWQTPSTSQLHHIGYDKLKLSKGCSIKNLNYGESASNASNMNSSDTERYYLVYRLGDEGFLSTGMTLQVKGQDNSIHYIIIYTPGTRIRTSDTQSES